MKNKCEYSVKKFLNVNENDLNRNKIGPENTNINKNLHFQPSCIYTSIYTTAT